MHNTRKWTKRYGTVTYLVSLAYILVISGLIVGCTRLNGTDIDDLPMGQSATQPVISPTDPTTALPIETVTSALATATVMVTAETISTPPATVRATPSVPPQMLLADGLILLMPNLTHPFIIKQGQLERLTYDDALLLGSYAPLLSMAIDLNGQLFSLSVSPEDGLRPIITVQQSNSSPELFFDDEAYAITRFYGIVAEWLIVSLVPTEPPPGQAMGDLVALALDGSQTIVIGHDTMFTPIVAPDQSFVLFHEEGETKRWPPQDPSNTMPLPAYSFGQFSPNGRYLALFDQQGTLYLYDFETLTLVATDKVGGYFRPFGLGPSPLLWNHTSDLLAYVSYYADGDYWLLQTLTMTGETKGYENMFSPAFSPDGLQMAVRLDGQNLIVTLQTGETTPFTARFGQYTVGEPIVWLDLGKDE